MNIINEFKEIYGEDMVNEIKMFIEENKLVDEFHIALQNNQELLNFGVKYGIYALVEFLYTRKNTAFNLNTIMDYVNCIASDTSGGVAAVSSSNTVNTRVNICKLDKYTEARNKCINFLLSMKIYSQYTFSNKQYIYRMNPKYMY